VCEFEDGSVERLFVKVGEAGRHDGHGYWGDVDYESAIYECILDSLRAGTPRLVGRLSPPKSTTAVMVTEYVGGRRLGKTDSANLIAAARWLALLHRNATPLSLGCKGITRYDAAYYLGWGERTRAYVRLAWPDCTWIDAVVARYGQLVDVLTRAEREFIHGEFYPDNVLVDGRRICPVDWQSAALGPGAIDLASLTEGYWPDDLVHECEVAYARDRWPGADAGSMAELLDAARLYWRMRWLGDDPAWTASPERSHYVDDLQALAVAIGAV
jgi:aminoglycoside phosphotransferase (APT) family kinase protein